MNISSYNLDLHKHILARWAASRAASQSKNFKFKVKLGAELLLLGEKGSATNDENFTEYIKQIKHFNTQDDFDSWHHQTIKNMRSDSNKLRELLDEHNKLQKHYSYGIAAKILNCYLKVFFLEFFGKQEFADFIHPPVDALLLEALKKEDNELFTFNSKIFKNIGAQKIPKWTVINEYEYKGIVNLMKKFISSRNQNGLWKIESFWVGHQ